jgi:tellurite resistance protein TehA-like permease
LIALTFLTRFLIYPTSTLHLFQTDIEQTTYLSTTAIAFATLVELIALTPESTFGNWQYVSFALWWCAVLWSLVASITTYWLLIRDEQVSFEGLSPTLMYPTTGILATASAGSVVVGYTSLSVGLAMPVLVVAMMLLGAGESFILGEYLFNG